MKRKILLTLGIVVGLGLLMSLSWVGVTHATDIRGGNSPTVAAGDIVDSSLFAAGNNINVAGTVKGDVFCAGKNIQISGTVEGDVICAGQSVHVSGKVMGDVRIAGQEVNLGAAIDGSATILGNSIVVDATSKIGRDLSVMGNSIQVLGLINRDVLANGQDIALGAQVGRTFTSHAVTLNLAKSATIAGDLVYKSPTVVTMADGAVVAGATHYTPDTQTETNSSAKTIAVGAMYGFISMLIVGLALLFMAPRKVEAVSSTLMSRPLISFAFGFLIFFVTPLLSIMLFITLFGAPLGILLLLSWGLALLLSVPLSAYAIGWTVTDKLGWPHRGRKVANISIGLLIVTLVGLIPVLGVLVMFVLITSGLGALAVAGRRHSYSEIQKETAPAKAKKRA